MGRAPFAIALAEVNNEGQEAPSQKYILNKEKLVIRLSCK
jgi:hypothetical protein